MNWLTIYLTGVGLVGFIYSILYMIDSFYNFKIYEFNEVKKEDPEFSLIDNIDFNWLFTLEIFLTSIFSYFGFINLLSSIFEYIKYIRFINKNKKK